MSERPIRCQALAQWVKDKRKPESAAALPIVYLSLAMIENPFQRSPVNAYARRWAGEKCADRFVQTRVGALVSAAGSCDFILATVPAELPWAEYLNVLKSNGALCIVGASPGEVRVPAFGLIEGQKSIAGSAVGSNGELKTMLRFSADHGIKPVIELYAMMEVNPALARVRGNLARYRAVLANPK